MNENLLQVLRGESPLYRTDPFFSVPDLFFRAPRHLDPLLVKLQTRLSIFCSLPFIPSSGLHAWFPIRNHNSPYWFTIQCKCIESKIDLKFSCTYFCRFYITYHINHQSNLMLSRKPKSYMIILFTWKAVCYIDEDRSNW